MIVEMAKVHVLGPRSLLRPVLAFLQPRHVLEVREGAPPTAEPERGAVRAIPLGPAEREEERRLDETEARASALLARFDPSSPDAPGNLPEPASPDLDLVLGSLETERTELERWRTSLQEEIDVATRYGGVLTAFVSIRPTLDEIPGAETFGLLLRRDRPEAAKLLEDELRRLTRGRYRMAQREVDRERLGVVIAVPHDDAASVSRLLFEEGVSEIRLPSRYAGQPLADALRTLLQRTRDLPAERQDVEARIAAFDARWRGPLQRLVDLARERREQLLASYRCSETRHAFVLFGWIPAAEFAALARDLEAHFEGRVDIAQVPITGEEAERVPVLLSNPPLIRPFELLLGLVSLPRYGSVDPTPWMAVFYPLFFGAILGDVGHGLIALVIAVTARIRGWGGEAGRAVSAIGIACAISSIGFGFAYGELIGDLGEKHFGMHPLLLARGDEPMSALGLSIVLGLVHIALGLVLAVAAALRRRHRREAAGKLVAALVVVAAGGIGASALGFVPAGLGTALQWALLPLVAVAIGVEGLQAPLELLRTMGNVLSYARLMALGLAGVLLVDVANALPEILPLPAGVAAAIFLHTVAFALGLFSPAIQALRLQYVEFFDTFFEGGGRPWHPLARIP